MNSNQKIKFLQISDDIQQRQIGEYPKIFVFRDMNDILSQPWYTWPAYITLIADVLVLISNQAISNPLVMINNALCLIAEPWPLMFQLY